VNGMKQEVGSWEEGLVRIRKAKEHQELSYGHYANTAGKVGGEKKRREERRLDRDEKHHNSRVDMHYAQREAARERQKMRMREELDHQVAAKEKQNSTKYLQTDHELKMVTEAGRQAMAADLVAMHSKKAQELANQAALIAQMHASQQHKQQNDDGHHARKAERRTMDITPGLLAVADSWHTGKPATTGHLEQSMDASKHLSKPCGRPEEKPWVNISKSLGLGAGGVFGGDGSQRSFFMSTGGPDRAAALAQKAMENIKRDQEMKGKWYDKVTAADIKQAKKAAKQRHAVSCADRSLVD